MSDLTNPVIDRIRERRRLRDLRIKQKAAEVYATFTKDERLVVQFGMLPADKTRKADDELIVEFTLADGEAADPVEVCRLLAVALMDCANAGPDKMVV